MIDAAKGLGYSQDFRATNSLLEALGDESLEVRRTVVWALGFIGDPRACTRLLELVHDPDVEIRANAVGAFKSVPVDDEDAQVLLEALKDEPEVRAAAAGALGSFNQPVVIEALKGLLGDEDWMVRWDAAGGLGRIGKRTGDSKVIEILLEIFSDENTSVRMSADQDLGDIGEKFYQKGPLWDKVIGVLENVRSSDKKEDVRSLAHGAIVRTLKLQGYH